MNASTQHADIPEGHTPDGFRYHVRYKNISEVLVATPEIFSSCIYTIDCDSDGIANEKDNCPTVANPDQTDKKELVCKSQLPLGVVCDLIGNGRRRL